MANESTSQGTGSQSSQGDDVTARSTSTGDQAATQTADKSQAQNDVSKQFVTPEILKGVLDRQQKTAKEEFGKQLGPLLERLELLQTDYTSFRESLKTTDKKTSPKDKDGKELSQTELSELVELRKRVKDLEDANSKARDEADRARKQEKDYRFKTTVKDALVRHRCLKPEEAFRIIAPDLRFDENGTNIITTVDSEFGSRDMGLDEFVRSVVAEEKIPELFEGKTRAGSAARGSDGSSDGKFQFTLDQIKDPEFYLSHKEEIRKALEQNRVKLEPPK